MLRQCYSMSFVGEGGVPAGGMEFARDLLSRALGNQKAVEFMDRVRARSQGAPFDFLEDADAAQLANSLKNEHPQAIALILSHLKVAKAASVIAHLGEQLQGDVSTRIAVMDRVSPDVIKAVEAEVKGKLSTVLTQDYATSGGVSALVSILHQVDRATEKTVMDALDEEQPQLAEEVRQKMFMFENIVALDGRTIQRILRDVENKDLILALKGASEEVRRLIFANMSTRAAALLKEDLAIVGPVRLRDVEEAQQRIVAVIRQARGGRRDRHLPRRRGPDHHLIDMLTILKSGNFEYTHTVQVEAGQAASAPRPDFACTFLPTSRTGWRRDCPTSRARRGTSQRAQQQVEMMLNQARSQVVVWQREAQEAGWQAGYDEAKQACHEWSVRDAGHRATCSPVHR